MKLHSTLILTLLFSTNIYAQVTTMISDVRCWDLYLDGDDLFYSDPSGMPGGYTDIFKADVSNPCFVVPPSTFVFNTGDGGVTNNDLVAFTKDGDDFYFSAPSGPGWLEYTYLYKKDLSDLPGSVVEVSTGTTGGTINLDTYAGWLYHGSMYSGGQRYSVSGALPVSPSLFIDKPVYSIDVEGSSLYFSTRLDLDGTPPTIYSKSLLFAGPDEAIFSGFDVVARDLLYFDGMLYFIDGEGIKRIDPSLPGPTSELILAHADYGGLIRLEIKGYATGDIFMFVSETDGERILKVELSHAMFRYSKTEFCKNEPDPIAVHSGISGSFTSSPSGLSINYSTGEIDLSASTAGIYTVTHTSSGTCPKVSDVTITINEADDASFTFPATTFCQDESDPTATITGLAGGTFTSTPAGLSINPGIGLIDLSASTPDTYTVTYTTAGTCPNSSDVSITINAVDDASFTFPTTTFCQDELDPTPTITGLAGGIFTSTPAGISMDATTGEIDLSASTPGTYTITYATPAAGACPNSSDVSITINAIDDASFAFSSTTYCQNGSDPTPVITGLAGGTFTSGPTGLAIDASTGEIDLSASALNTYTITYTTAGPCPSSSDVTVTIEPADDASFSFPATTYCQDESDPTPTITGLGGGTFTVAPTGLLIDASTGEIDLSASVPNTYTVTYTTSGPCPNSFDVSVTINAFDDASFVYSATTFCQNETNPTPVITGLTGGTFTSAPAGLSIDPSTGEIDLLASDINTYIVTYNTAGPCPNSSDVSITILPADDASFIYPATAYCQDESDPTPTITGLAGGTFTFAPTGLFIDISTGEIDLSASTPNTYVVTYTTAGSGSCPNSSDVSITIYPVDDASFTFPASIFCQNGADPTPTISGLVGGTFTSAPVGLAINPTTGEIDLSASEVNTYTVTYTTVGPCPSSSDVSITINPADDASFTYTDATFCIDDVDPTPTITGLVGGTFTSAPAGLSINPTTGEIDLSASIPNTYIVTYTTPFTTTSPCPNSHDVSITINPADDASFAFTTPIFCQNEADPTPIIFGMAGGIFTSAPAGLSMNTSTGEIDLSESPPGTYTVTYTTTGPCPNSSDVTITINPADDASFTYTDATFCIDDINPTPTITGLVGGTFTSAPAGLSINPTTGEIDLSESEPSTYTVTYITDGLCPNSSDFTLTINSIDVSVDQIGYMLEANIESATYQWLDCDDDFAPIPGETEQQFMLYMNGSYAVQITYMGCTDTSECILVDFNSVTQTKELNINIYPNPSNGEINIQFSNKINQGTITIRDIVGKLIVEEKIQGINSHSLIISEAPGVYFIEVSLEKRHKEVFKFIIK